MFDLSSWAFCSLVFPFRTNTTWVQRENLQKVQCKKSPNVITETGPSLPVLLGSGTRKHLSSACGRLASCPHESSDEGWGAPCEFTLWHCEWKWGLESFCIPGHEPLSNTEQWATKVKNANVGPTMIVKQAQFFSNVLFSFSWIGHCALFPSKEEEIQQIDLFDKKKICQLASK